MIHLALPTADDLRACQACGLAGAHPVPGEAWGNSDVMVIGEAPGAMEAQTSRPFVGESGRRLRRMLEEAEVRSFYLTNVLKHRPMNPPNRDPTSDEVAACLPFLRCEVGLIQPKVLVLVGATAMCLTWKAKGRVKKTHGRWGELWNVPCVAMIHPAAIGRMSQRQRGEWEASSVSLLQQARRKAEGWELPPAPYEIENGPVPLGSAFDIETTGLDQRHDDMILAAAHDGTKTWVYDKDYFAHTGDYSFSRDGGWAHLLMHHSAFDATVLARLGIDLRKLMLDDTMVLAHVKGMQGLSLGALSSKLLGEPMPTFDFDGATPEQLAAKCAQDVVQTYGVWGHLVPGEVPTEEELQDFQVYSLIERPLLNVVAQMTASGGFEVEHDEVKEEVDRTRAQITELEAAFAEVTGTSINMGSGDQVAKVLTELGLPLKRLTPEGDRPSVDALALRPLLGAHPCVGILLARRALEKRNSTYLVPWLLLERLVALWHQTGTRTFRFSSSQPNLQNVPVSLRRYCTARPGNLLVSADASQIEYKVAAHLSQEPAMLEAFRAGTDFHTMTQERFGMPDRRMAKVFNFGGLLFGGSAEKMLEEAVKWGLPLTWAQAEAFIEEAHVAYPTYYRWARQVGRKGMTDGYVDGLYGRRFRLLEGLNRAETSKLGRQAVNYPIQGGASDIVKLALARAWWKLGRPINALTHDEITFEVAEHEANDFVRALQPVLLENNPLSVPLTWDIRVSRRWKE